MPQSRCCDLDEFNRQLLQFIESRHSLLLGEISRRVLITLSYETPRVLKSEFSDEELVDEHAGVLIDGIYLKRLLEDEILYERSLAFKPGTLEHGEETCVFLCVEPHYIAVDRRIGLGASSAPAGNLGHKSGFSGGNRIAAA